ncbi:NAD(P)/FAD-dependent oxidoreductase [Agrococcus sp. SGAir0287]|uniref:NAD(P)/FAD-dependent oxidoreductase n=1 Tax=Agrococcus sp. SGAir0287 TaxID=2070347 RepID=UPI0020C752D7|nr:FAD-binding oxidoreductase [Agrococcus sp. SGAir0287]
MTTYRNGEISHWAHVTPRPALRTAAALAGDVDLLIVGAGLTGLWLAYHALVDDPSTRVLVVEAERVGYGGSGRNGGWLSPLVPGNRAVYERSRGVDAVRAFQRAMLGAIDDTLAIVAREGIEAGAVRGGQLRVATGPAGLARLRAERLAHLRYGLEPDEAVLLGAGETRARIAVEGALGGLLLPATARVQPAALVAGLAAAVEARGGTIVEGVRAESLEPRLVRTSHGPVRTRHAIACTEAYSGPLVGERALIPVRSSMIVTTPIADEDWARIGWEGRECLGDAAHAFVYAQRTDDGRIAIGGRGSPYAYDSGLPGDGAMPVSVIRTLHGRLRAMLPGVRMPVAHAWRGVIGVTRDWCARVHVDDATGIGHAYGYAGHGVTATNLAAQTLLDRIRGRSTPRTALPWNDHDSGTWEPEPLRFVGVHAMYRMLGAADAWEERTGMPETALLARVGGRIAGLVE